MKRDEVEQLLADRDARRPAVLVRWLDRGTSQLVHDPAELGADVLCEAARAALVSDRATVHETPDGDVFVQPFNPPLRLVIVGAVHIAQHLVPIAHTLGYAVTVIDPRSAFASEARFPGTTLSHDWPDRALAEHGLDARTALVALSHDPKLDDPALQSGLRSQAFYVGALGSRGNHARRLERLREAGFGDDALARIHGPIGLAIGARSPAEIALSIAAQLTATLRQAPREP